MNEEKETQKTHKNCCDEDHEHDGCCEGRHAEKHIIHASDDCCEGKKKMIIKLPFGRKNLGAMKDFTMLKMIDELEGVTGYDLGKLPDMPHGSVMRKLDELKKQGYLRSEEEETDGKKKVKYFVTDEGKKHFEELKSTFHETFSFLGDDMPFEHFGGPMIRKKILHKHPKFDIEKLESKEEVNDYLVSIRHRLNIVKKRIEPRLERIKKARVALDEAISKVESLSEFSKDKVKEILDDFQKSYRDVWDHHPHE